MFIGIFFIISVVLSTYDTVWIGFTNGTILSILTKFYFFRKRVIIFYLNGLSYKPETCIMYNYNIFVWNIVAVSFLEVYPELG